MKCVKEIIQLYELCLYPALEPILSIGFLAHDLCRHLSLATLAAINFQLLLKDFQGHHNCTTVVRTDSLEVAMEVGFTK